MCQAATWKNFFAVFSIFELGGVAKHLMTGPTENSDLVLFPLELVIKWLLIWESGWFYPAQLSIEKLEFLSQQKKFWPIPCYQLNPIQTH